MNKSTRFFTWLNSRELGYSNEKQFKMFSLMCKYQDEIDERYSIEDIKKVLEVKMSQRFDETDVEYQARLKAEVSRRKGLNPFDAGSYVVNRNGETGRIIKVWSSYYTKNALHFNYDVERVADGKLVNWKTDEDNLKVYVETNNE